ncbi:MAG: SPOR domain-containing protein [Sphingomonas sp.]|nr:SPOR domain-containing protein [Sphingomonas sp.]
MSRIAFKIAASTMIVSLTMTSGTALSGQIRGRPASAPADREAARAHEQGARALRENRLEDAREALERAVAAAPRDAGYRLLLADIYLKAGRFDSARATYADVLELDPSNRRAGMSFALTQIALGRPAAAVAQLDHLGGIASDADRGLAYALAGHPERGLALLEPLARSQMATPRARQNLALAHALAGDWRRARAIAAQDISPADVEARMTQWAALARPDAGMTRIAGLLGVTPVASDPGQPVRLALSRLAPAPVQVAEAAPVVAPLVNPGAAPRQVIALAPAAPAYPQAPAPAASGDSDWGLPAEAPVRVAEAPSYYLPVPQPEPEAPSAREVRQALAVQTLNRPSPAVVPAAAVSLPPAPRFNRAAPRVAQVRAGDSRYVVQLGAFSNEANAERAWVETQGRHGLTPYAPLTVTIDHQGRTLHRVAVAGFASEADARRLCGSIQAQGGECFVRENAGDAAIRWAARYASETTRNA